MTRQQQKAEQLFLQKIQHHLENNNLYYSYDYDITQSLQRQINVSAGPRWKKADDRFFWNRYLCSKMITAKQAANQHINDFILPIIQGFVSINTARIRGVSFAFALISRRSRYRAGTRYFSRGIDKDGNVSNFVETEQLVVYDENAAGGYDFLGQHQLSFVQTRGSIPLFWAQVINMRYTPRLWLDDGNNSLTAMKAHFKEQTNIYGPQILVNLVNKKGYEYPLAHAYSDGVKDINDPNLTYIHFDFHHECRKMRWDRINLLIEQIEEQLSQQGYCHYNATNVQAPYLQKSQTSVIRSNCMDCLDRTNVVQSTIAKWVLTKQLQELRILSSSEKVDEHESFMHLYRQVWSDNADVISLGYSGTGALKTDYTRTGKRTKMGAFEDLTKSLARYIKNNYMDGGRQDGIDLVLGVYEVPTSSRGDNPFDIEKPLIIRLMPLILLLSLTMCAYGIMLFSYSGITYTTLLCLFISFWFSTLVTAVHFMLQNSQYFVDWPRLVPLPGYIDSAVLDASAKAGKNGFLATKLTNQLQRRGSKELSELEQGDKIPLKKIS
ncbi:Phosphoinositide phosphatase sac1 [Umbelopsis sp. WA50703]